MTNQYPTRRKVLTYLAGAIAFPEIVTASQRAQQKGTTPGNLSYLDIYNPQIDKTLSYFKNIHRISPRRNLIKSIIAVESGTTKEAFEKDPMQIANEGDFALEVLANGGENTFLMGDFSKLKGKTKTPRNKGHWDYSSSNLDADSSIYGGIGWLYHKAAIYQERLIEEGDVKTYIIQKGDSFSKLSDKLSTTTKSLINNNPKVNPAKLKIGQTISYRNAKKEPYISAWRTWENAVIRYNGGGDPTYFEKVSSIRNALDARG